MTELLALPESLDPHTILEWIEMTIIVEEMDDLSTAEILNRFASGQRPPSYDVELALAIADERSANSPMLYPFRHTADRLVRCDDVAPHAVELYTFFRISCLQGAPWAVNFQSAEVGTLFDYPVAVAMERWMGDGAQSIIFGWPPRGGRPTKFSDALSWLAERLQLPDGDLDRPPDDLDGTVDIVVWKPNIDGRSGFPVWLVQASVEWQILNKAGQAIPLDPWKRWIKFGAGVPTVFATAHSVPHRSNTWMQLNDLAFMVADRSRLLHLLDAAGVGEDAPEWMPMISDFVDSQLEGLRNPGEGAALARVRKPKRERTGPHADPAAR